MNLNQQAKSISQVNKAIQTVFPKVCVHKSEGCFFIYSDDEELGLKICSFYCTSIYVHKLNQLTLQEWVDEVKRIFNENENND